MTRSAHCDSRNFYPGFSPHTSVQFDQHRCGPIPVISNTSFVLLHNLKRRFLCVTCFCFLFTSSDTARPSQHGAKSSDTLLLLPSKTAIGSPYPSCRWPIRHSFLPRSRDNRLQVKPPPGFAARQKTPARVSQERAHYSTYRLRGLWRGALIGFLRLSS